jgi:Skp family chaperone for outer membrane proteins
VNYARKAEGVPTLTEQQWKALDADKQETHVHSANDLWMPSEITEEKIPGLIARYKGLKDTLLQRADTVPEFRTEVAAKFDSAINMLTAIQGDHVTRKLDYKAKEAKITEEAKVRAEDRADARRKRNNDEPSIKDANLLRDDYNRDLKQLEWPTIQASMARIQASAKDASPAGDLSLIFNFMKMLDPGSVVRESEFNNAATAAPFLQRYGLEKYSRVWKGEKLTTDQRADFVKRARNIFSEIKTQKSEIDTLYKGRAKRYSIPEADILSPDLSTGEQQSGFTVTDPRGVVHNFASQEDANNFKREAGIQ